MGSPGRLSVSIAKDAMSATVVVRDSDPFTKEEILESLRAASVVAGIDDSVCDTIIAGELETNELVIAVGSPPVAGENGSFIASFESGLQPGKVREDGSIDFHERDLIKSAAEGEQLGTLKEPTKGIPGQRVDGRVLPASDGKPAKFALGPGVSVDAEGAVRAARAGVIVYRPGVGIDVSDRHMHKGDVDLRSGDLHLQGTVSVSGSVCRTFSVTASHDVEVGDCVDAGSVQAGGHVRVRGVVRGGGLAVVSAEGDVVIRAAESAVIRCGGTLRVAESLNSQLVGKRIEISRRMRGGSAVAEEALVVQDAGAPDGTPTVLTAGEPMERSVQDVLAAVEAAKAFRNAQKSLSRSTGGGADLRAKGGKLGRAQAVLSSAEMQERVALAAKREALAAKAFVHVGGAVHAGVVIHIGGVHFNVDQEMRSTRFKLNVETRKIEAERPHR